MSEFVILSAFKQTYYAGRLDPKSAEPALAFSSAQSPNAAIKLLGGSTRGKLILCTVPKSAPKKIDGSPNPYAGKIYAVVEVWAVDQSTAEVVKGYQAPKGSLEYWISRWPRCLPIRKWYDIREPRLFADLHPDALKEAQIARGKLRTLPWLTKAAGLKWGDLQKREVYRTPA